MLSSNTNTAHNFSRQEGIHSNLTPLKSTCVELKSVLTVLLAYPPLVTFGEKSLFWTKYSSIRIFRRTEQFLAEFTKHNPVLISTNLNSIKLAISKQIGIIEFRARLNRTHNSILIRKIRQFRNPKHWKHFNIIFKHQKVTFT